MDLKKTLLKSFWDYHAPPAVQKTSFSLWGVLVEAWQLARGQRLKFLMANYVVVLFSLVPILAPFFAQMFPRLMLVPLLPVVPKPIAALLTIFMPWFYLMWVTVPLKLGLLLIATRIVYHQTYKLSNATFYYLRFFWLVNVLACVVLIGFFLGTPIVFVATKLVLLAFANNAIGQHLVIWATGLVAFMLSAYAFISCLLLFLGRVNTFIGFKTMLVATTAHFWRILAVIVLIVLLSLLSKYTWHVSDLIFAPFSYLVCGVLYQRLFGAKACRA